MVFERDFAPNLVILRRNQNSECDKIIEWLGLEETSKIILLQLSASGMVKFA